MQLFIFQHAAFEMPGFIIDWAQQRKVDVQLTRIFDHEAFPPPAKPDGLILLGGPMSIQDTARFPWLTQEKSFLKKWLKTGKPVMGICLGAQLLAELLGAKVYPNAQKEIGWFPVQKNAFSKHPLLHLFPENTLPAFHWHGETFDIPADAVSLFSSEATQNQAFVWNDQVFGLQFHWEVKPENVQLLIENGEEEINQEEIFIQSPEKMLHGLDFFDMSRQLLFALLDFIFLSGKNKPVAGSQ